VNKLLDVLSIKALYLFPHLSGASYEINAFVCMYEDGARGKSIEKTDRPVNLNTNQSAASQLLLLSNRPSQLQIFVV
jgi:hypothetical protein